MRHIHSKDNTFTSKILHVLSQRPDSTGSSIYVQAMLREASKNGHANFLAAGIQSDWSAQLDCIDDDHCRFVKFTNADISYPIVGMSDVMPYESTRFGDLSPDDQDEYETSFSRIIKAAADAFQPDIIHSHHLWIVSSLCYYQISITYLYAHRNSGSWTETHLSQHSRIAGARYSQFM